MYGKNKKVLEYFIYFFLIFHQILWTFSQVLPTPFLKKKDNQ